MIIRAMYAIQSSETISSIMTDSFLKSGKNTEYDHFKSVTDVRHDLCEAHFDIAISLGW